MTDAFYGEIMMTAANFPPRLYTLCLGQLMPISQNSALFSIIGTTYGGDGRSTFGVPNLKGRAPIHVGGTRTNGPGLSTYFLGERIGFEQVTLSLANLPIHSHGLINLRKPFETMVPSNTTLPSAMPGNSYYSNSCTGDTYMSPSAVTVAGGNEAHENRQPYTVINYSMCMYGVYPPRN